MPDKELNLIRKAWFRDVSAHSWSAFVSVHETKMLSFILPILINYDLKKNLTTKLYYIPILPFRQKEKIGKKNA